MGYYCTVPQCTSLAGKTKNVKFHRFPRDNDMANKWNLVLKRGKPITKYSKVCSLHFTQADYNVTTMGQWKTLSKDAIPTQNLPKLNPDGSVKVIRKSRTMKYKECRKDVVISEKEEKWGSDQHSLPLSNTPDTMTSTVPDHCHSYRLHTLSAIASNMPPNPTVPNLHTLSPQIPKPDAGMHSPTQTHTEILKTKPTEPKKQDAIMQTDPILSEDEGLRNTSYSETSEKSFNSEGYPSFKEDFDTLKKFDVAEDYTKSNDDYIPQTNEEYNKEAEKYALERKSRNGYDKLEYQKRMLYSNLNNPEYARDILSYHNYSDSVEILRNQQHNLQLLQEQHRVNENQNFFNENHIKQEIDFGGDEEKVLYEQSKDIDPNPIYDDGQRRVMGEQRLLEQLQHHVKQEPDTPNGCDSVMQPQSSPFYNGDLNDVPGLGYYDQTSRPGPEMLIAKQNALASQPQLWQNTMKRPFFFSERTHFNNPPLLHRYDDLNRILQ